MQSGQRGADAERRSRGELWKCPFLPKLKALSRLYSSRSLRNPDYHLQPKCDYIHHWNTNTGLNKWEGLRSLRVEPVTLCHHGLVTLGLDLLPRLSHRFYFLGCSASHSEWREEETKTGCSDPQQASLRSLIAYWLKDNNRQVRLFLWPQHCRRDRSRLPFKSALVSSSGVERATHSEDDLNQKRLRADKETVWVFPLPYEVLAH